MGYHIEFKSPTEKEILKTLERNKKRRDKRISENMKKPPYSSRKWLISEYAISTHTNGYIFCHWGYAPDWLSHWCFIKIGDCDRIITFYIPSPMKGV